MIDVSAFAKTLNGKPVVLFGMGVSNRAAEKALKAAGVETATADDREPDSIKKLLTDDLRRFACLVLAPGVPRTHPLVKRAQWLGLEILCDIEILHRSRHGRRVIGVTGTNGKSTTTALIGHILNENGIPAVVGGNIGRAALDLDLPPEKGVFVLELSSYQLDLCSDFAPDIAVLLNVTADHIDHHGTMEKYIAAKEKIFRGLGDAVIAVDDDICRQMIVRMEERAVHKISAHDDGLPDDIPTLPGLHNRQNMAAARAAARIVGLADDGIYNAMKTYPGLPHRQQIVRKTGGVTWVNDSKATNADAAAKALSCYDDIYWIAGGRPKEGGLVGLDHLMDRVRHAFLIGEAQDMFASWLKNHNVPHEKCGTLDHAVAAAQVRAQKGVVLLSPACASFDQFKNFEERGHQFVSLVSSLKEKAA